MSLFTQEKINQELAAFMEWPTADQSSVTTTSAILFAEHIQKKATEHLLAELERMREALLAAKDWLQGWASADYEIGLIESALSTQPATDNGSKVFVSRSLLADLISVDRETRIDAERRLLGMLFNLPDHSAKLETVSQWQPIETAPKDGTIVRLLVEFDDNATEDTPTPAPTIGCNNFDNDEQDEWSLAGWDWSHDCFTAGYGKPIGWLPMLDSQQAEVKP